MRMRVRSAEAGLSGDARQRVERSIRLALGPWAASVREVHATLRSDAGTGRTASMTCRLHVRMSDGASLRVGDADPDPVSAAAAAAAKLARRLACRLEAESGVPEARARPTSV